MSQLDDAGCYVTMGGGRMTIKKGLDHPTFLDLSRFDPKRHSLTESYEVATAGSKAKDRQALYSIPLELLELQRSQHEQGSVSSMGTRPMASSMPVQYLSPRLTDAWKTARKICLSGQTSPREPFVRNGSIIMLLDK